MRDYRKGRLLGIMLAAAMCLGLAACGEGNASRETGGTDVDSNVENSVVEEVVPTPVPTPLPPLGEIGELPDFTDASAWESDLYVEPVSGIDGSFIRGVDISSYISVIESGATFKDYEGRTVDEAGFFEMLRDAGVNWVRIRIWNNPYDTKGNSYGGGHNDLGTAIALGRLATKAGMQVMIDFHYSDFWADPNKQTAPKAWAHMTYEDKKAAMGEFTESSLQALLDAEVNVAMVQVGNETVAGLAGETDWERICELMNVGSAAIRSVAGRNNKDILIAMHFTNPDSKNFIGYAKNLHDYNVDYDVFGSSYYSYWHGTTEKLTSQLQTIAETYGKKVVVLETSYAYTDDDGDGWSNSISTVTENLVLRYEMNQQGQVNAFRDVCQAVSDVGEAGMGVFYWEPAWIPVQKYDAGAADAAAVLSSNQEAWETYGSGWASSFAKTYDPKDAGVYYGGSSWDNQAMFDFDGNPLESLRVYKYIYGGTTAPLTVQGVRETAVEIGIGQEVVLPETVPAVLLNGKTREVPVVWDAQQIADAQAAGAGVYEVAGVADVDGEEYPTVCSVEIKKVNYVKNPGFEDSDMSMWDITGVGVDREDDNNKRSGTYSLKFWAKEAYGYRAEQEVTGLPAGTYELGAFLQGGDAGKNAVFKLYITVDGETFTADSAVSGWLKWDEPHITDIVIGEGAVVTVGVEVECAGGGWGAWDDFYLYKMD